MIIKFLHQGLLLSRAVSFILLLVFLAYFPASAQSPELPAATITVTSHLDTSGNASICTLRDAITAANTNSPVGGCPAGAPYPAMDVIKVGFTTQYCLNNGGCTIILSSPLPAVSEDVTIQNNTGIGFRIPTISGDYKYRIFDLQGVIVNISNLILIRGNATGAAAAGYGGAINTSTQDTTLQVTNVVFSENHAQSRGGAVLVAGGTVTINNSTFTRNTVDYYGGAIGQFSGVLILTNSTIEGNSALDGGGIEIQSASDTRITNVTISGNIARGRGGGISRIGTGPTVSLNNVTITNNIADSTNLGGADGGGIYRGGGTITIANSIIAGNYDTPFNSGTGAIHPDCSGVVTSFGYNLIGIGDGCSGPVNGVNADKVGSMNAPILARLNPLGNYGGSTATHSLQPNSPAVDAGNPITPGGGGFGACAATDQRNVARPVGANCDIGAYEGSLGLQFLPFAFR